MQEGLQHGQLETSLHSCLSNVLPVMLQDVEKGRRTEIDYLNGFIVRESKRYGIDTPINAAIADLIRHIEKYPE